MSTAASDGGVIRSLRTFAYFANTCNYLLHFGLVFVFLVCVIHFVVLFCYMYFILFVCHQCETKIAQELRFGIGLGQVKLKFALVAKSAN